MFGQPEQRVNTFIAAFDSDCATCGGFINTDDEAGYLPDEDMPSCPQCLEEHEESTE